MNLNKSLFDEFSREFDKDEKNILAKNAATKNNLNHLLINNDITQNVNHIFSNYIHPETKASNQRNSGRCWLFAFQNMLRLKMIEQHNIYDKDFEFSHIF